MSVHILGQQYDKNGDRKKWWTDKSIAAFKNRTQCFVDQYSQYEQQGIKVCTTHTCARSHTRTHALNFTVIRSMVNSHLGKTSLIMEASTLRTKPTKPTRESRSCIQT